MHKESIALVKEEMTRLQKKIDALEAAAIDSGSKHYYYHPKETGAVRRASMDLTRALADLRRTH